MAKRSTRSGEEFDDVFNEYDVKPNQEETVPETADPAEMPTAPVVANALEIPLPTEVILKSKAFRKYQRDFARVLLPNKTYTVSEAKSILDNYFRKDGDK